MKPVQVLLRENVEDVGRRGDVVRVAAGYARNYLIPQRLAVEATPEHVRTMMRRRAREDSEAAARSADVEERAEALSGVTLRVTEKADETGRLFGSVNATVVARLLAERGFEVDEKDVRLDAPIKAVGTHAIEVHVHGDRSAEVTLEVAAEV